jgi:WD40 repeat protein/transcriptional regulator with XRE-family HTH domain
MATEQAADRTGESFQGLLLRHRGRTGLTQRQLAERVGVSRGSVQNWEAGLSYPDAQHLQALTVAFLEVGGLTVGGELSDAEALWDAVLRQAPRMQTPFDAVWWAGLLARRSEPAPEQHTAAAQALTSGVSERRQDWGGAPDVLRFVGRVEELATLRDWVLAEHCRLVAVLGMGGIGKTALAARLAQDVTPSFQRVYWRSLRDAPPISEWLAGAIGFLSDQQVVPPDGEAAQLTSLLQLLRDRPCLLVLDNFETVLEPGQREGRYRASFAGYGALLRTVGETNHQSCVIVTSREAAPELAVLSGGAARRFELGGLRVSEGQVLLADKQLVGNPKDWASLIGRFGGNGLALKVVSESVRQVFGGDIGAFLEQSAGTVIGGVRRLLAEQFERSSALEQDVLRVLAVEREPVSFPELLADVGPRILRGAVLEAVAALRRRSLVERAEITGASAFTLQSVVLEFVTDRLVEEVRDEIAQGRPVQLVHQPLIKALAKDYVRETQERLIGAPILQQLQAEHGDHGTEQMLLAMLEGWRNRTYPEQGYGPGNVVNLLRLQRGNLRGLDLAHLGLRQAYLAGVEAQDASLLGADLSQAVLAEAFNYAISVALSGDGAWLLAGTSAGEVWLWRVADRTPLLALPGHSGPLYSVALSADGRLIAGGSEDGTVRLWEAPSGRLLATLQGHTSGVWGVALSADGRLVASGSFDGTIKLWEAPAGQSVASVQGHTGPIYGVALSADGRLLASGGEDGMLRLWDAPSGRPLTTLAHPGGIRGVALSADGRLLASAGEDGTIRLWDSPSARLLSMLEGQADGVWGVVLSADGRLLASRSRDKTIRLWETPGGQPLATLHGHTGLIYGVALSADGQLVTSGSLDGTIRLWEATSGRPLATLQGQTRGVRGVALSADGRLLADGSLDGNIRLWDAPSGQLLATLQGHTGLVHGVVLSADGSLLASGSWDGTIQLWDVASGRLLATLQGHSGGVRGVALSADGRLLASGGLDGMIRLWEAPSGRQLGKLQGDVGGIRGVALSADGRLVASTSWDGTIRLWAAPFITVGSDAPSAERQADSGEAPAEPPTGGRPFATLAGHTGPVHGVAISADGRLLASGGEDGTVRLWDPRSAALHGAGPRSASSAGQAAAYGRLLATLDSHTHAGAGPADGVRSVALSADGRLVASGSWNGTIRMWEAPSGRLLATLHGHTGGLWGVALSADGRLLASGSFDGTIRLWEVSSGACLRTLRSDRRYERVNITGLTGVTAAQRAALVALGAVEQHHPAGDAPADMLSESAG